jgi:hypothetical protein
MSLIPNCNSYDSCPPVSHKPFGSGVEDRFTGNRFCSGAIDLWSASVKPNNSLSNLSWGRIY